MLQNGRVVTIGSIVSGNVDGRKVTGLVVDIIDELVDENGDKTKKVLQVIPLPTYQAVFIDAQEVLHTEDAAPADRVTEDEYADKIDEAPPEKETPPPVPASEVPPANN